MSCSVSGLGTCHRRRKTPTQPPKNEKDEVFKIATLNVKGLKHGQE